MRSILVRESEVPTQPDPIARIPVHTASVDHILYQAPFRRHHSAYSYDERRRLPLDNPQSTTFYLLPFPW
jgi:hypothetical protein